MPKNYYIILGIPVNSTQDDIKAAYRRLAKEFHPDRFGTNQAPFQVIQEAYSVLSDPARRRTYDITLKKPATKRTSDRCVERMQSFSHGRVEPLIPEEDDQVSSVTAMTRAFNHPWSAFDNIFDNILSNFSEYGTTEQQSLNDLTIQITLTPEQAQRGGNVRIAVPMRMRCPSCHSYGQSMYYECWRCNGTGVLVGEKPLLLSYPAGITENHSIKMVVNSPGDQQFYLTAIFKIR